MALSDDQILRQNPWWTNPGWSATDPHLHRLADRPRRLPAGSIDNVDLEAPGISVLRGPRQVGKTTSLKLLVERAIAAGRVPRRIVYLALDLLEGEQPAELAATVTRAKDLAGAGGGGIVLLDEVTVVERWQTAVKSLWDDGQIRADVVVCTGSSALDLQRGAAERLPGRRQAGRDYLALPQTFGSFARAQDPGVPPSPRLTVADLRTADGVAALREARVHAPALERALRRYLTFGGLPAAVVEAAAGAAEPSDETRRVLYDSLVREVQRAGASVAATHALLERILRSLGSKTSWSQMAREMDVPLRRGSRSFDHRTLRDYIELLAGGYFLFVAYFWRADGGGSDQSKDKKVFFADPLLSTIALDRVPGTRVDLPALVENAVGVALYRRYEPADRLPETFALPERLHVWRTARGGEIDFVCGLRRELDVVEVKYSDKPHLTAAAAAARAHPGRPVVMATKSQLDVREDYALIPAHILLWALG